ncbi:MAG TPA: thiol-disulfide isomerase [Blastocatellia bacterium]|nr:thiol-disulfide isomerase [Blastocatellia bacterium]
MRHRLFRISAIAVGLCAVFVAAVAASGPSDAKVTFTRDVAPIFYNRCIECHRPGEVAPMSLITFSEARPWAKAIKQKVVDRSMPPWLASPDSHQFKNDRRLSQKEIDTISAWVDAGAPKGEDKDLPPAPKFEEGWAIGKPDAVVYLDRDMPVPAEGVVPYKYVTVPTNFDEDKWVQAAEIRPGNRKVVHHIIIFVQEPGGKTELSGEGSSRGGRGFKLCGFAPGEQPKTFPPGTGRLIKKGSKLTFQLHYTPNGEAATDRSYVGLIFSKAAIQKVAQTGTAINAGFVIPAGEGNYEVRSSWAAPEAVRIVDLMPHMHVRGKDFTYTAVYPDGRSEIVLRVPRYDFNWQLLYQLKEPLYLPKGARLDCVAHFDNSPKNKYNPDPTKEVRWGDQTWEEMMIGWFDYVLEKENLGERAAAK